MKRILRNVCFNWAGFFVNVLITVFVTPFVIRSLGEGLYGIWALTLSLTGYFGILNFGVYHSVVKYISQYRVKGDYEQMSDIASACFSLFSMIGFLICLIYSRKRQERSSKVFISIKNSLFSVAPW